MAASEETPLARRRYNTTVIFWLVLYVGLLGFAYWAKEIAEIGAPLMFFIAVLPALPIGFIIMALMRLIRDSDEYFRELMMKRYLATMGVTLFLCTVYGFVEQYGGGLRPPLWVVFPLYWFCYPFVSLFFPAVK